MTELVKKDAFNDTETKTDNLEFYWRVSAENLLALEKFE